MPDSKLIIMCLPYFKSPDRPHVTGGLISNFNMACFLAKKHNVVVLSPSCNTDFDNNAFSGKNIVINAASTAGIKGSHDYAKKNAKALTRLISENKNTNTKIIILSTTAAIGSSYPVANKAGCRHIILCRAFEDFVYGKTNPVRTAFHKTVIKRLLNRGQTARAYKESEVITNSNYMKAALIKSFACKNMVHVLYPPVDINGPKKQKKASGGITVGFINRGAVKGHELVLELAAACKHISFKVYGSEIMAEHIPANIHFEGWQKQDTIFSSIDLLLVPSKWPEPFGRVAVEAQACGIPVLVSNHGGLPETVVDNDFLVPEYSVSSWKKVFISVIDELDLYRKKIADMYSKLEKYSQSSHDTSLEKILFK